MIESAYWQAIGNMTASNRLRINANKIWRELKMRLLPTDPSGNPRK